MGGIGSATGGCRQQHNARYLTATVSPAGRIPPPLRSVTSRLLELYHECVDNGDWARVLYDTRDGLEKLTIIRRIRSMPAPNSAAPPAKRKPGRQASDRRRERDRRRREAWAERRHFRSQSRLQTASTAESTSATAEPATTELATPSADVEVPQPTPQPVEEPQPAEDPPPASPPPQLCQSPQPSPPLPMMSPQPAPPPRKRAKTLSEATQSSSRTAVLAKKRQIP